eukprot:COSAG06_NODE_352_length_16924_cov_168.566615_5_plen_101_part_00
MRLDERRASRAACLSCGLCAQLTWASRYLCTMRAGELGRRTIWRGGEPVSAPRQNGPERQFGRLHGAPGRGRSIGPYSASIMQFTQPLLAISVLQVLTPA